MRVLRCLLCAVLLAVSSRGSASGQIATSALGGAAGLVGGGYITMSIVVAQSRVGHYLHDIHDLFDWKSTPIIIGTLAGGTLGAVAPDRLYGAIVYGAAGTVTGLGVGLVVGPRLWPDSEGKWAGAAIGAGAGLALGSVTGILLGWNSGNGDDKGNEQPAAVYIPILRISH